MMTPELKAEIAAFVEERDAMLLKMDLAEARAFHRKHNPTTAGLFDTMSDEFLLRALHKARTACLSLPREARQFSKDWLTMHGSASMDGGDLSRPWEEKK